MKQIYSLLENFFIDSSRESKPLFESLLKALRDKCIERQNCFNRGFGRQRIYR